MWPRAGRPPTSRDRSASGSGPRGGLTAFALYLAASLFLFGLPLLGHLSSRQLGPRTYPDSRFFVWAMAWWPHAVGHGLNPIWTKAVWAPLGFNLAWATGAPGPCLAMTPVTLLFGPVVSYNVLGLLAPALSALAAFVLFRYVTGRFGPSLLAGYVFGFSTYAVAHVGVHVNLELVALVPLSIYLVLRRLDGTIGRRAFVALFGLLLVGQFLISTEIFATLTLVGAAALVMAVLLFPGERRRLGATALLIAISYAIAAVVVVPFLYYAFVHAIPRRDLTGSDLLSFFLPRSRTLLGGQAFEEVTQRFPGAPTEDTAYLGPPLLVVLVAFAWTWWRRRTGRLILIMVAITALATLGPTLFVDGKETTPLPWRLARAIPVLDNVAPRRFSLYVFLLLSMAVALWLGTERPGWARWGVAALIPLFLFPRYSPDYLHAPVGVPAFFANGAYREVIGQGDIVMILPLPDGSAFPQSESMLIQAETGFWFRLVIGYTGPRPPEYHTSAILQAIAEGRLPPVDPARVREFLSAHEVRAVIVEQGWGHEQELRAMLGVDPTMEGGVAVYRLPP